MAGGLPGQAGHRATCHVPPMAQQTVLEQDTESAMIQNHSMVGICAMGMQQNKKYATQRHVPFMGNGQIGHIGLFVR